MSEEARAVLVRHGIHPGDIGNINTILKRLSVNKNKISLSSVLIMKDGTHVVIPDVDLAGVLGGFSC